MKVLVFKALKESLGDADPFVDSLQNAGIDAESVLALSFQYINQDILKQKVLDTRSLGGFIFTSPRSVVALAQCMEQCTVSFELSSLPAYVVGEGTSKVLREKLGLTGRGEASGNATQLAQFIIEDVGGKDIKPLLFPCAELQQSLLVELLSAADVKVDYVTAYKTIPHPSLFDTLQKVIGGQNLELIVLVFFSPSGVSAVFPHISSMCESILCCNTVAIGPTTETALKEKGFKVLATAEKPSPAGLVQAIKVALSKLQLVD